MGRTRAASILTRFEGRSGRRRGSSRKQGSRRPPPNLYRFLSLVRCLEGYRTRPHGVMGGSGSIIQRSTVFTISGREGVIDCTREQWSGRSGLREGVAALSALVAVVGGDPLSDSQSSS